MFQVNFVMTLLFSLAYGILYKTNNTDASTHNNLNRATATSSFTSASGLSAISNYNKSQELNFQNKFYKIITFKNDNDNQNMIYVTPISVSPPANNVIGSRAWGNRNIVASTISTPIQSNFNQNQHLETHRRTSISRENYDKIKKLLLQNNNGSINNNYANVNGNKNNYLSNTKNSTNNNYYDYDKRADNNYIIKNDTNLSFSHNYPIIDSNYKNNANDHDYYHKNVNDVILQQQQQHRIYDNIKLGGIYDYHSPPNPLLQVLFSRYGRHLPHSYFPSTRNYGFYAYGAGNDINNNLPNGRYKIEMEFDSNK